jgi:hypothetical protein
MKTQRAERLRTTIDFLPPETKRAMLDGLERNRIITGANTDRRGGVCPMIAADRNAFQSGPMADIFAAVWDSYNGACILNRRDASERDLRTLKTMLETSIANSPEFSSELGQAWLDYHTDLPAAGPDTGHDFDHELTTALRQSSLTDTASMAPSPTPSVPAPAALPVAAPVARRIDLVCDDGPLPLNAPATRSAIAPEQVRSADPSVRPVASGPAATSTYEPYRIAVPQRRAPATRASVDAPTQSRAARHAAQAANSADRAKARAVIANQAATLRGREWPRSALRPPAPTDAQPQVEPPATSRLDATTIRQAAIPRLRSALPGDMAPAVPGRARPGETGDRTAEPAGRTGWSWLPPFGSYDDAPDAAGGLETGRPDAGPGPSPELEPSQQQRPVRM